MASHGPLTYRQRDLAAAMRAALQAGFPVREIYIDRDGKIVIVAGAQSSPTEAAPPDVESEWDKDSEKI
jgi:hypothetical protein